MLYFSMVYLIGLFRPKQGGVYYVTNSIYCFPPQEVKIKIICSKRSKPKIHLYFAIAFIIKCIEETAIKYAKYYPVFISKYFVIRLIFGHIWPIITKKVVRSSSSLKIIFAFFFRSKIFVSILSLSPILPNVPI